MLFVNSFMFNEKKRVFVRKMAENPSHLANLKSKKLSSVMVLFFFLIQTSTLYSLKKGYKILHHTSALTSLTNKGFSII